MTSIYGLHFRNLGGDLSGGITAAIIALPLALAFGVASGAGPAAGLWGAIFVGIFAALFGGTPAQVSGPTGPMTVVMASVYTQFSAIDPQQGPWLAFTVVMMAGLFQIGFGLLKLGRYITLVPFPVISGFMSGIGVIIIVLQLAPLLGQSTPAGVSATLQALPELLRNSDARALGLGTLTLLCLWGWPKLLPLAVRQLVPAPLAALIIATFCYLLFIDSNDSALAVIGDIPAGLPSLQPPQLHPELLPQMLTAALMLAALGAIDSLLTSLVADNLSPRHHDSDRELLGQGIGNLLAGCFGGLPGAGATVRTVVNIRAGGETPISGAVHGLVLLILVLGAAPLAESIPHAVLAGILIRVGVDIIDWNFLRRIHQIPPFVAGLMLLVLTLTVFADLIMAVGIGVFIANLYTVKRLSDLQLEEVRLIDGASEELNDEESRLLASADGRLLLYCLNGPVSFGAARAIHRKLSESGPHDSLLLDLSGVPCIDVSTAMAIEDIIVDSAKAGRQVRLIGMTVNVRGVLTRMRVLSHLQEGAIFAERLPALEQALNTLSPCPPD